MKLYRCSTKSSCYCFFNSVKDKANLEQEKIVKMRESAMADMVKAVSKNNTY